jgi:tRNA pseudouridine38-40 synthase
MRIAVGVEYDGSRFCGWQLQNDGVRTVQGVVESALSKVANHEARVICAGRTDTGVHATGQVIHFETDAVRDERAWVFGANANLPKDVVLLWAKPVSDEFHARFSAVRRSYRYVIFTREVRPTFLAGRVTWHHRELEINRMQQAGNLLLGEHDFSSYRAVACQAKSPVRTLHRLEVNGRGPYIFIDVEANGFLHHMVRNIAGVLMAIGEGEKPVEWSREVLEAQDRTLGGVTAHPSGLYLTSVGYPEAFGIPQLPPLSPVW